MTGLRDRSQMRPPRDLSGHHSILETSHPIQPIPLSLHNVPPSARPEMLRQVDIVGGGTGAPTGLLGENGNSHVTHHLIGPQPDSRLPLDKTSSRMNEEVRSMSSDASIFGDNELSTELGHVCTLDYLVLDMASPVSSPHQLQSAFASHGIHDILSSPQLGAGQLNALTNLADLNSLIIIKLIKMVDFNVLSRLPLSNNTHIVKRSLTITRTHVGTDLVDAPACGNMMRLHIKLVLNSIHFRSIFTPSTSGSPQVPNSYEISLHVSPVTMSKEVLKTLG
ncbi:hypothetical protein CROQUDRAFT_89564 [Cronartium quercuum f. sp. fusiforme G11]|uniref:Uncharacterized protein n=1 Tax=Cronartium quercuum f. sp. fusiforme G11 TaxID=708437 RepID=A0A9P6NN01_9BASI|nr:hypothetical protein CROQUDRAFT_89564 [Cronartium quercuum f. sp. fusiforme G11]